MVTISYLFRVLVRVALASFVLRSDEVGKSSCRDVAWRGIEFFGSCEPRRKTTSHFAARLFISTCVDAFASRSSHPAMAHVSAMRSVGRTQW